MRKPNLVLALCIAAFICGVVGCGGTRALTPSTDGKAVLAAPVLLEVGAFKATSSTPSGIYVTWTRSEDPSATGYYLYRDTDPIPMPPPDDTLPVGLRRNSGELISQPASGTHVTFNDMGPLVVGQTYYYRVTVYDGFAESYPSNEMSWTVHGHTATTIAPSSAAWGDAVTISGDTFGTYDVATDAVKFPLLAGGDVDGIIEDPGDWTDTSITVTVPDLATTGLVSIVIDGIISQTDDPLTILNPRLTGLDPAEGFREQALTIEGENFGAAQEDSTVFIGMQDMTAVVTAWGDTSIELAVPADAVSGAVQVTKDTYLSNTLYFTVLPEILSAEPVTVEAGEPVTVTGRLFGATEGQLLLDGTDAQVVSAWSDTEIAFTLAGAPGMHTLVAVDENGLESNAFQFEVVDPLAVALTGLDPVTVYRFDDDPVPVGVTVPADADRVELREGETVLADSTTSPFDDMALPVTALTSGAHDLYLRAYRRAVEADSTPVAVSVYSLIGDLDGNGDVGQSDADLLPLVLGLAEGMEDFYPWLDPDDDGVVTEADLALIGFGWGNTLQ